ncbi:Uncharacterised protein [Candidatus Bilamarchaeum dharawalense]|uniref:Cytidylyltransferase family protein n=1 Tax=Candidatus Bilamarchaeum dharawalense TaxID=2885759 RepID=A0A5E4LWF2_9ARCH|nr:Uncharacterised protein [Candidatus Bilamarchaeum dharawalense]
MDREVNRQMFHLLVGLIVVALLLYYGRGTTMVAVFFVIIFGLLIMNARLLKSKSVVLRLVQWFEKNFERTDAPLPGWGSACYAAGVLITISVLPNQYEIIAVVLMLALGDSFSTIIGRKGRILLPHNKKKTLEGAVAFFVASLPIYYFIGPMAIPLIIVGTIIETLPLIDDNLMIPIVATTLLVIF